MSTANYSCDPQAYPLNDMAIESKPDETAAVTNGNGSEMPILTRFNQQFFLERVNHVVLQTNHYNGALSAVWEKIEQENAGRVPEEPIKSEIVEHGSESAMHIDQLQQRIRNAGILNVVLEAAHAYAYQSMEDDDFVRSMEFQYEETNKLVALLTQQRVRMTRVLFIDNYNPNPVSGVREDNLDIEKYLTFAKDHGFPPDYLIWEADMAPLAKAMIEFMQKYQSLVVEKENGDNGNERKLHLDHRGIELFSPEKDKVSCAGLDAALSLVKYQYLGQGIANILPKRQVGNEFSFRGQQKKVRQILMDHLGVRVMPFFNIFTSETEDDSHSSGAHNAFRKKPR